jgi:hypothetical protein
MTVESTCATFLLLGRSLSVESRSVCHYLRVTDLVLWKGTFLRSFGAFMLAESVDVL